MSEKYTIIDVREPFEYKLGHISTAINISAERILEGAEELNSIPKDANIIVYCRSGSRSALVVPMLKEMGFKNVINGINKEMVAQNFGIR
jgi:rhodanese-related sulfurtransferase